MALANLRRVLEFLSPHRHRLAAVLLLTLVVSVLAMLPPLLARAVVDQVIVRGTTARLPRLALCMLLVPLAHAACGYLQVMGLAIVGQRFVMTLRDVLYRHLLTLSLRFYAKHSVGKLVNRLMDDSASLLQVLRVTSVEAVSDLVAAGFAVTVAFLLNWRLAFILVLFLVLFVVNCRMLIARIRRATRSYRGAQDRLAGGIQNRLVANLTVKTYGAETREHRVFREQSDTSLDWGREGQFAANTFNMNTTLLRDLGRAVVYFLSCALVLRGEASYGDVVAFTAYAMQLLMPAVRFSMIAQQFQDARVSLDRLFEVFDERPEVQDRPGARRLTRSRGAVDFDHVRFAYEEGRPVLEDFDLHVAPGERIALVGPTGCGKTTILSLLLRFFDVTAGAVRIDGLDVRDIALASLRRQFGLVLQESLLFDVSIAENIRYSRLDATPAQIVAAARLAQADGFIRALENGYEARLGRRGIQLSTGQRQRISIARAVLAEPSIIVMDEATSALDSESESAIQTAIDHFLKGRTAFVVAHRLSTIRNADRIVLLRAGRIAEIGNHEALMRLPRGLYRGLYEKHAGQGVLRDG